MKFINKFNLFIFRMKIDMVVALINILMMKKLKQLRIKLLFTEIILTNFEI